MTIAVDFDGTIVEHKYPEIGKEKPFAIQCLKQLQMEGNRLILWTSREDKLLEEAIAFCHERGLDFYAVNGNQPDDALFKRHSAKVIADVYLADHNLGGIPEDWGEIYEMITKQRAERHAARHKKSLFFWHNRG
jgi:hypothetical protein